MKNRCIRIPSAARCRQLIAEMGMMNHIVAHSLQVCRVALLLTDRLALPGLDRELVRAAALLHDITKTRSFTTHEDHAATGSRLLAELGFPEVGRIIGQHVYLEPDAVGDGPTEAEIVNYADKRVLHDEIAPLDRRMGYILERYGAGPERRRHILDLWCETVRLEARIFSRLSFGPEELGPLVAAGGQREEADVAANRG